MGTYIKDITDREVDFAKWYTDIVKKADLVDYSNVKGSMIIRPYAYAIWENIVSILDKEFNNIVTDKKERGGFLSQLLDDWYNNKISKYGSLSAYNF